MRLLTQYQRNKAAAEVLVSRYGLLAGDHLVINRGLYSHHGIFLGNGLVAHFKGLSKGLFCRQQDTGLRCENLQVFAGDKRISVQRHRHSPYSRDQILARARSRLGEDNYRVLFNNCEHFCRWCWMDEHVSMQVRKGLAAGLAVLTAGGVLVVTGLARR